MPNYDVSADEPSGGTPEPYAGKELLAQMKLRQIDTPAIVVTMFDSFGGEGDRKSLANLMSELKSQYSPPYIETVFYDTRQEGWRSSLSDIILTIERNGKK